LLDDGVVIKEGYEYLLTDIGTGIARLLAVIDGESERLFGKEVRKLNKEKVQAFQSPLKIEMSVLSGGLLWLRTIGYLLPQTYALDILRKALLLGTSWSSSSIQSSMVVLAISCLILLPLGFLFLKMGIDHAKKYGTLSRWV